MKVLSRMLSPSAARGIGIMCAAVFVAGAPSTARAAAVVGTGTAASCTDAALNAALAGGGLVTFNCDGPATIDISTGTGTKTITADTTVDGGGLITISGGNTAGVFSVNSGVNFTVENLTIANGNGTIGGILHGGGIVNPGGTLTVTNSTFIGNHAFGRGGGISHNSGGTLIVTESTFTGNSATVDGGGIFNEGGTLTVTNSTFTDNSGGGISNGIGTLTVTNSSFTDNSGGGIVIGYSPGRRNRRGNPVGGSQTVTAVANSAFIGNTGFGGLSNLAVGAVTVTNSSFGGNSGIDGGGIFNLGRTLTVTNSTFTGNSADDAGGGISNGIGTLTVTNSTFTGNSTAPAPSVSGVNYGGGIFNDGGTLTVINSTFTGNSAAVDGGGIFSDPKTGATAVLRNTIVANSPAGGNCSGPVTDGGHNLDDGTSCGFSTTNGSLNNTNPQLDPAGLRDNGGPTQTVALCMAVGVPAGCTAASSAIDAVDQAVCAAAPVNNRDQRGFVRPGTGHTQCSIGAYEADATAAEACVGDCSGTQTVAINDIITMVNIALGNAQPSACPHGVPSGTPVDVALIIQAVNNALNGCGVG